MINQNLGHIISQATSLSERLNKSSVLINEQETNNKLLEHWCEVVASGNWENFHKRLQWDGLDIDTVISVLSNVSLAESEPLPTWAETLRTYPTNNILLIQMWIVARSMNASK